MTTEKPEPPNLPKTLREPLARQPPDRLDQVSAYADQLARWKRTEREREATETRKRDSISEDEQTDLEERGISIDPTDYEGVATSGAYITIKETKPGYKYYYWRGGREIPGRTSISHLSIQNI
ncbi:hypothetical protein [Natronococcus jeotgali]|uniref:hypothetical protein n=1 Tax=Natronococcus jeotgali TaxID=413812 RepID=UPI001EF9E113|nr:hypothetical protein [Natronococcus jeotgali]